MNRSVALARGSSGPPTACPCCGTSPPNTTRHSHSRGARIGVCLHVEPKTAVLLSSLRQLGAEVVTTGNFGTTQDDVVTELNNLGGRVIGSRTDDAATHLKNKREVLDFKPQLLLDNGAELYSLLDRDAVGGPIGGTEETTSGAERLRAAPPLGIPILVINDSPLKRIFENEIGVGQSILSTFQRVTTALQPAKRSSSPDTAGAGVGSRTRFARPAREFRSWRSIR